MEQSFMRKGLSFFITCLFSTSLLASPAKEMVFFGDSLTDDGNLLKIMKIIPKSPPYYKGRFTNGITWAEQVGNYFYHKSYINYANYCYGGATTIPHSIVTDKFISPMLLQTELDSYFAGTPFKNRSDTIFSLWIGANDYLYETTPEINGITTNVTNKIEESAIKLLKSGAYGVLLMNLPDLALTPFAKNHHIETRLHNMVVMHNAKLTEIARKLSTAYPNKVVYFDIYNTFNDVLSHPDEYNSKYHTHITNTQGSCWLGSVWGMKNTKTNLAKDLQAAGINQSLAESPALQHAYTQGISYELGNVPCDDSDQYVFWDDLHPTAVVHNVLGQMIIETLENNKWL
jgi:phospholipase/lecithinase/hemolysin